MHSKETPFVSFYTMNFKVNDKSISWFILFGENSVPRNAEDNFLTIGQTKNILKFRNN